MKTAIDPRYINTCFDYEHSDKSGPATLLRTSCGFIWLTPFERGEYNTYGRMFESSLYLSV